MPEIGKTALFRLEPFQALCKVVWVKDELCGVRFDELLTPRLLAHFRKVGDTTRVGMLTPDEQHAKEEWTEGLCP